MSSSTALYETDSIVGKQAWIVNARYDQLFLVIAWLLPFLLIGLYHVIGSLAALLIFGFLDRSHVMVTMPLTLMDEETMRRDRHFYVIGLTVLIIAAIAASFSNTGTVIWRSIFIYWVTFHIIRQHYGFLRLYQAKAQVFRKVETNAEIVCLYSGLTFPVLMGFTEGSLLKGTDFIVPTIPLLIPLAMLAVFIVSLTVVVFFVFQSRRNKKEIIWTRYLHIFLAVSNFWLGLLLFGRNDFLIVGLFIGSYHNLQYHAIIRFVMLRRQSRRPDFSFFMLFQSTSLVAYIIILCISAIPLIYFGSEYFTNNPMIVNLTWAIIYSHYLFDGRLWQLRKSPEMKLDLNLVPPQVPQLRTIV